MYIYIYKSKLYLTQNSNEVLFTFIVPEETFRFTNTLPLLQAPLLQETCWFKWSPTLWRPLSWTLTRRTLCKMYFCPLTLFGLYSFCRASSFKITWSFICRSTSCQEDCVIEAVSASTEDTFSVRITWLYSSVKASAVKKLTSSKQFPPAQKMNFQSESQGHSSVNVSTVQKIPNSQSDVFQQRRRKHKTAAWSRSSHGIRMCSVSPIPHDVTDTMVLECRVCHQLYMISHTYTLPPDFNRPQQSFNLFNQVVTNIHLSQTSAIIQPLQPSSHQQSPVSPTFTCHKLQQSSSLLVQAVTKIHLSQTSAIIQRL